MFAQWGKTFKSPAIEVCACVYMNLALSAHEQVELRLNSGGWEVWK